MPLPGTGDYLPQTSRAFSYCVCCYRNAKQWTPLDCCASVGMHKSAVVLLEADAPVDAKDKRRITPLQLACGEGHKEMVEVLLRFEIVLSLLRQSIV